MSVTVKLRHLRISPRKVRLVTDLIRGKTVNEAEEQLKFAVKKASKPVSKLLHSGVKAGEHNEGYQKDNLKIGEIRVDRGPILKRVRARAQGAFYPIQKRTSHVTITLEQIKKRETVAPEKKKGSGRRRKKKEKKRAPRDPELETRRKKTGKNIFQRKAF